MQEHFAAAGRSVGAEVAAGAGDERGRRMAAVDGAGAHFVVLAHDDVAEPLAARQERQRQLLVFVGQHHQEQPLRQADVGPVVVGIDEPLADGLGQPEVGRPLVDAMRSLIVDDVVAAELEGPDERQVDAEAAVLELLARVALVDGVAEEAAVAAVDFGGALPLAEPAKGGHGATSVSCSYSTGRAASSDATSAPPISGDTKRPAQRSVSRGAANG